MPSIFDQFPSQAPVDVAGTPFQDQPSAVSKLLFGKPEGPDVRDPQKMAPARYIVAGGKTLDPAQDAAWDDATASPNAKRVREIMGSEPMKRLMDLANFIGPGPKMMPRPTMAPEGPKGIKAYHGSPHDFDKFDLSRIGTGEGAQAYGHGLYFAEAEDVARSYRNALSKQPFPDGDPGNAAWHLLTRGDKGEQMFRRAYAKDLTPEQIDEALARAKAATSGRMYEVNIKADPQSFLDYDVPISQQPQARAAVEQAGFMPYTVVDQAGKRLDLSRGMSKADAEAYAAAKGGRAVPKGDFDFDALQKAYRGKDAEISKALAEAGIPGVKYKDAGSRDGPGGTSNYVVFSDDLIEIVKKYGLAGLLAGGGALSQGGGGNGDAY